MKFSQIAFINALLAASAVAAPRGQKSRGLTDRVQRRANSHRSGKPLNRSSTASSVNETSHVDYSSNWSGAVIESPPSGETFNAVSGTFTVPTPSVPSDGSDSSSYAASAWVGIDGDTYTNAILQTGVDFTVTDSGDVSYDAWYEWYPNYAIDFSLSVSAGDVISLSVVATTTTSGTATIENETTGETASIDLTSTSALGGQNAEWIVEDFEEGDSLVAFADFGTVVFTSATASTAASSEDASGATLIDIESDSGSILTDASVSGSTVTVSYT